MKGDSIIRHMFIDVHCHFDMLEKQKEAIEKAIKKGVKIIATNGTNVETNRIQLELASQFPVIKAALGLYPIKALKMSDAELAKELAYIEKNASKIVAIGEVGMDFKESEDHERQKEIFRKIISLAKKLDKPLIVHSRKAELACIELLEEEKATKVVMHCFSGKLSLARRCADNGWILSIPANVVYSEHFQTVIKQLPIENLLGETDSPYLHPKKEWPNEPANVIESYKKIAELKSLSLKAVEKQLEENYKRLFQN